MPHVSLQIKFSTKSFGIEAAEVAARAIEHVAESLAHADISDIIAGRPEKEVLGALQIISRSLAKAKLKALDLSDNALGQKGIVACTQAFAQQVRVRIVHTLVHRSSEPMDLKLATVSYLHGIYHAAVAQHCT